MSVKSSLTSGCWSVECPLLNSFLIVCTILSDGEFQERHPIRFSPRTWFTNRKTDLRSSLRARQRPGIR